MSTRPTPAPSVDTTQVASSLIAFQAVRLLRHPLALGGLALTVLVTVISATQTPRDSFSSVTSGPTFFYGTFVFFAANLVASRERRAHSEELLAPVATTAQRRVQVMLAATFAPALVTAALVLVAHAAQLATDRYFVTPTPWHLVQSPLTVLGGGLLGVAVARWFPMRGAAFVAMVALVVWNVWTSTHPFTVLGLGMYVEWPLYGAGRGWSGLAPGSAAWHDAYLVALCGLAAVAALLPGSRRRTSLAAAGAFFVVLAALSGTVQLP